MVLWISRYFGVQYHPFTLEFSATAFVLSAVKPRVQLAVLSDSCCSLPRPSLCAAWAGITAVEMPHLYQYYKTCFGNPL